MKSKPAVINAIWLGLIVLAVLVGMATGTMDAVTKASFDSAKTSVDLALKLVGVMALWLGLMKIAEAGGLMRLIARAIRPLMVRLFPEVPAEHPAMAAMIMNMAANMLGLGNAATPMGIKAMIELDRLNPVKGRATDAMCLFLAINTSSVTLLPLGVIGVRAAAGVSDPASIIIPGLVATICSTLVAVLAAKLLAGRAAKQTPVANEPQESEDLEKTELSDLDTDAQNTVFVHEDGPGKLGKALMLAVLVAVPCLAFYRLIDTSNSAAFRDEFLRAWIVPMIMLAIVAFGYLRGVKVYEAATEGAKEGFQVAIRIIPFLVMILVAIGMFKASGAFAILSDAIAPLTNLVGVPAEVLPMALMRPLSGSGAFGVMSDIVQSAPDSLAAFMASIMQGSTETTFYVLAVYFGAVGVTRSRHAIAAALLADAAGLFVAIVMARLMF